MVVHQNMTVDRFLPDGLPNVQQQVPPLPAPRGWKIPRNASQPSKRLEHVPQRTPPALTTTAVAIREPVSSARPPVQVGSNVASSLAPPITRWQSIFMLGDEPLLVTSSIRNWFAEEGGWIAWSLRQALQLPNDVRYFADGYDEAIVVIL